MASKMILLPTDFYHNLLSVQQTSPTASQLYGVNQQLENLLNDNKMSVDEKFIRYQDMYRRHKYLLDEQNKPMEVKLVQTPTEMQQQQQYTMERQTTAPRENAAIPTYLMSTFAEKGLRKNAQMLVQHMQDHPDIIRWNDNYELLQEDMTPVEGSNVQDLIIDFTRQRNKATPAIGAKKFSELLRRTNIPRMAVNNESRLNSSSYQEPILMGTPPTSTSNTGKNHPSPNASQPTHSRHVRNKSSVLRVKKW